MRNLPQGRKRLLPFLLILSDCLRSVNWMQLFLQLTPCRDFIREKTTLYKDPQEGDYYLILHQSQHTIAEFQSGDPSDQLLPAVEEICDRYSGLLRRTFPEDHHWKCITAIRRNCLISESEIKSQNEKQQESALSSTRSAFT